MSDRYQSNGSPPENAFSMVQRVRFGDLDAMQHMNNVEYLRFFETARIDYLMGVVPEHNPGNRQQFGFIFAECHIAYRSPAHFIDVFRTWYGPVHKAFGALPTDGAAALARDLTDLLTRHNVAGPTSLVVPSEYLEVVVTRK